MASGSTTVQRRPKAAESRSCPEVGGPRIGRGFGRAFPLLLPFVALTGALPAVEVIFTEDTVVDYVIESDVRIDGATVEVAPGGDILGHIYSGSDDGNALVLSGGQVFEVGDAATGTLFHGDVSVESGSVTGSVYQILHAFALRDGTIGGNVFGAQTPINIEGGTIAGWVSTDSSVEMTAGHVTGALIGETGVTISGGSVEGTIQSEFGTIDVHGGSVTRIFSLGGDLRVYGAGLSIDGSRVYGVLSDGTSLRDGMEYELIDGEAELFATDVTFRRDATVDYSIDANVLLEGVQVEVVTGGEITGGVFNRYTGDFNQLNLRGGTVGFIGDLSSPFEGTVEFESGIVLGDARVLLGVFRMIDGAVQGNIVGLSSSLEISGGTVSSDVWCDVDARILGGTITGDVYGSDLLVAGGSIAGSVTAGEGFLDGDLTIRGYRLEQSGDRVFGVLADRTVLEGGLPFTLRGDAELILDDLPAPVIVIEPAEVVFEDVEIGAEEFETVFVRNTGSAALGLSSIFFAEGSSSAYRIVSGGDPGDVLPGGEREILIGFAPMTLEPLEAMLVIASNDLVAPRIDVPLSGSAVSTAPRFVRGDVDGSGAIDITDGIVVLHYQFIGDVPPPPCLNAADTDNSGVIDITDGIYILHFQFLGGPEPPAPYPECGLDPEDPQGTGVLGCATAHPACEP